MPELHNADQFFEKANTLKRSVKAPCRMRTTGCADGSITLDITGSEQVAGLHMKVGAVFRCTDRIRIQDVAGGCTQRIHWDERLGS